VERAVQACPPDSIVMTSAPAGEKYSIVSRSNEMTVAISPHQRHCLLIYRLPIGHVVFETLSGRPPAVHSMRQKFEVSWTAYCADAKTAL